MRESQEGHVKIKLQESKQKKYVWWKAKDWITSEGEWKKMVIYNSDTVQIDN